MGSSLQSAAGLRNVGEIQLHKKRNVTQADYRYLHMGELNSCLGSFHCFTCTLHIFITVDSQKATCALPPAPPGRTSYEAVVQNRNVDIALTVN